MIFSLLALVFSALKNKGILSFLAVGLLSINSWPQTQLGTVSGTISDTTGAVLPGVRVTVSSPATGLKRDATTDLTGQYHLAGLPIGTYVVRLEKEGFRSEVRESVALMAATAIVINASLR